MIEVTENVELLQACLAILFGSFGLLALLSLYSKHDARAKLAKLANKHEKHLQFVIYRLCDGIDSARPDIPRNSKMGMDEALKTVHQIMTDMASVRAEANRYSLTIADQRAKREVYAKEMEGRLQDEQLVNINLWDELFEIAKIRPQGNVKVSPHDRLRKFLKVTMKRIDVASNIDERIDEVLAAISSDEERAGLFPQQKVELLCARALHLNKYTTMYMKEHDQLQATIRAALARRSITPDYRHNNELILDALVAEMDCDAERLLELRGFMKMVLGEMEDLGFRSNSTEETEGMLRRDAPAEPVPFEPKRERVVRGGEPEPDKLDTSKTVEIRGQGHQVMPTTDPTVIEIVDVAEADPESLPDESPPPLYSRGYRVR